ncbi:unnamed protein product [Nezara viridula]|uniref:Uncharacterized protein n=1 Tax=Nezara viridula TaxID=85310 RepID=A0A9P0HNC5_NEZVI|nr:unnamed protein product [Nezara viridula]
MTNKSPTMEMSVSGRVPDETEQVLDQGKVTCEVVPLWNTPEDGDLVTSERRLTAPDILGGPRKERRGRNIAIAAQDYLPRKVNMVRSWRSEANPPQCSKGLGI